MGYHDNIGPSALFTRDEAAAIVEMFEEILCENDVSIPSPEDDERDEGDTLGLYGSVYSDLLDSVEERILQILMRKAMGSEVISGKFSGTT